MFAEPLFDRLYPPATNCGRIFTENRSVHTVDFLSAQCYNDIEIQEEKETVMTIETLNLGVCMTNCYLASADGVHCVIVDPAADGKAIYAKICQHGWIPDAILLTHAHFDHISGLSELNKAIGNNHLPVILHEDEVFMLTDTTCNLSGLLFGTPFVYNGTVHPVTDGDTLHAGGTTFRVLHTPGHTSGSVCYVCDTETLIFSGDTLFASTIGRTDFPGGDTQTLLRSLQMLKTLPDDYTVYPGHNAPTTLLREKQYNEFLQ